MESFRRCCASICVFWKFDPNGKFLRLPYLMMAIGVVHLEEGAQRWKRWMMATNRLLATYQYCVSLVAVLLVLQNEKGAFALIWSVAVVISFTICNVKAHVLQHYLGVIRDVGRFVDGKPGISGDAEFDLNVRHEVFRIIRGMSTAVYWNCFCVQIIMAMPIEQIQRLFGAPEEFGAFGPVVVQLASSAALLWKPFIWMSRLFSGTVAFTGLLVALNAEMKIVRHGFEGVTDRVRAEINDDIGQDGLINGKAKQEIFWKYLNVHVKLLVEQHIEILRNVNLLKSAVGNFYFIIHYYSLACVSAIIAVSLFEGFSFGSVAIAGTACGYFAQCYWWCHVTDSFEDTSSDIAETAYSLAMEIPYSEDFRQEYKKMMKILMIVQVNAARCNLFTCGGVFPISITAFGDLCNLTYSAITFVLRVS